MGTIYGKEDRIRRSESKKGSLIKGLKEINEMQMDTAKNDEKGSEDILFWFMFDMICPKCLHHSSSMVDFINHMVYEHEDPYGFKGKEEMLGKIWLACEKSVSALADYLTEIIRDGIDSTTKGG